METKENTSTDVVIEQFENNIQEEFEDNTQTENKISTEIPLEEINLKKRKRDDGLIYLICQKLEDECQEKDKKIRKLTDIVEKFTKFGERGYCDVCVSVYHYDDLCQN